MNLKLVLHSSILVGAVLGGLFWILEAVVHACLLPDGRFLQELLAPGRNEVRMRLVVVALLIASSIITGSITARLKQAAAELQQNHLELNVMLGQVMFAKQEWEMTLDCIEHMVILIDGAGLIKRCNRAVKEIAALPYQEIIGRHWQELLMADKVQTGTIYGNGIELCQPATGRWFVLHSYPFNEDGYEGKWSVITIHDSTAMKRVTEEVEQKKREIEEHRGKLQLAVREISTLIQQVACLKDFGVRFKNPKQRRCYEIMGCSHDECPCFGKEATRCWQVFGSCRRRTGDGSGMDGNCAICPVFKAATSDPVYQIGEHFNNMMHIIEWKNRELELAYNELKAAQARVIEQEQPEGKC